MTLVGNRVRQHIGSQVDGFLRPCDAMTGPDALAPRLQVEVCGHQARASKRIRGSNQASTTSEISVVTQIRVA